MNYLSFLFVIFTLITVFIYYLVPQKNKGIILLISSLLFYLSFNIKYIFFLLFVAITTFICAKTLKKIKHKKIYITIIIVANVIVWSIIKILPWTLQVINILLNFLGFNISLPTWSLLIPIGISYYILQAIGYVIDVYNNRISCEKKFWKYLLFLSYFPIVVQGPISKYDQLMPEILKKRNFSFSSFRKALILILIGLIKKIVIADRVAIFVNYCFGNYSDLSGIILYLGAISYSVQIYMDFSGCVDICRGVSKIFGINLINNFNRPYFALSIKDFWKRWHMSFSTWLKEYIYIPLGGNRKSKTRKYLNLLITFLISSIWHGAGFSFLFWGALHSVYQIIGELLINIRKKFKVIFKIKQNSFSDKLYKIIITFNLVTFAWIFFRSNSFIAGIEYIKNMLSNIDLWVIFQGFNSIVNQNYFNIIILHLFLIFLIENKFKNQEDFINDLVNLHIFLRWFIYLIFIFDVILFGTYGSGYKITDFMYGGF